MIPGIDPLSYHGDAEYRAAVVVELDDISRFECPLRRHLADECGRATRHNHPSMIRWTGISSSQIGMFVIVGSETRTGDGGTPAGADTSYKVH